MITCTFEDGITANPKLRHMAAGAIVLNGDRVLLVKRSLKMYNEPGKWGIVGGLVDQNESLAQCIKREILEETGYEVFDTTLLHINSNPNRPADENQNIYTLYYCQAGKKVGEPDDESTEQKWFSLDDLPPKEDVAFDHYDSIDLYKRYLKEGFSLPYDSL